MKEKKFIIVLIVAAAIILIVGGYTGQKVLDKAETSKKQEKIEQTIKEENVVEPEERFLFFQEEVLDFLSESFQTQLKKEFSNMIEREGDPGTTCCVVLSNVQPLSSSTYQIFVQTNESENNLYQIIVNESEGMLDMEAYNQSIPEIETYGGVGYGDTIERIYLQ